MASAGGFLGADDVGVRTFIVPPGPACHPQTRRTCPPPPRKSSSQRQFSTLPCPWAEAELLRSRISFFLSYGSDAPPQMLKAAAQLMPLDPARARETYLEALIAALLTRRAGHQGGATLSSGHMVRRGERGGSACVAG